MTLRDRINRLDGGRGGGDADFVQDDWVPILEALDNPDPLGAIQASSRPDLTWYIADYLRDYPGYVAQRQAELRRLQPWRFKAETEAQKARQELP